MEAIDTQPLLTRHRLSVADYYRMGEAGIFAPHARVELIEGEVVDMPRATPKHASAVMRLSAVLVVALADRGIVSVHNPVRLSEMSEPVPDLVLLKPRDAGLFRQGGAGGRRLQRHRQRHRPRIPRPRR